MASKQLIFDILAVAETKGFSEAAREVDRLGKSSDGLSKSSDKSSKSLERQTKNAKLLSSAIVVGAGAAVPVAAAAAGALVGLGAAAGVAVVGFLGIRDAMKEGTPLGKQYQAAFKPVVSEFSTLKQIAAANMFAGINAGVKSLKPLFPALNRDVAGLSTQIGEIAGHVGPGLVSLFHSFEPLFASIGDQLVRGSAAFEHWAQSSTGLGKFVAYAQNQLPTVEATLGSLAVTVGHLAQGIAPFGSTTVTAIRLFSTAINSIPIGALQVIVPLLAGLKVGSSLSASFNNAAKGIEGFAAKAGGASGAVSKLGKAVGYLGPVGLVAGAALGGLSAILGGNAQKQAQATAETNSYTQALLASHGAIDQAIRDQAAKNLQDSGALDAARKLGIALPDVTDAALDQGKAQKIINDLQAKYPGFAQETIEKSGLTTKQYNEQYLAADKLARALGGQNKEFSKSEQQYKNQAAAAKVSAAATAAQAHAIGQTHAATVASAKALGLTTDSYISAKAAADANTKSTNDAAAAMQAENNAAGLLAAALDKLGGNNLGVAQAQTAVAQANNAATKALGDNKGALKGSSDAALADQQALQGAASAALAHGNAVAKQTGSSVKATAAINADKAALEANLAAHHKLTPQVQAYIDTLFKIPPVKSTAIDAKTAAAEAKAKKIQAQIDAIKQHKAPSVDSNTAAGKAKIAALQHQINAITQGKVPGINANTNAGRAKIASLQAQINAIRQSKVPSVSVSASQAVNTILTLQRQIAALHNKTVQITVQQQQIGLQGQRVAPAGATGGTFTGSRFSRYSFGGTVGGYGGSKADNQWALLSPGEEVTQEPYASRYRGLLKAINAGQNVAALVAGVTPKAATPSASRTTGGPQHVHVTVGFARDATGDLQLYVRDITRDESEFAAMTGRMGSA